MEIAYSLDKTLPTKTPTGDKMTSESSDLGLGNGLDV